MTLNLIKLNPQSLSLPVLRAKCWAMRVNPLLLLASALCGLGLVCMTLCMTLWLPEIRSAVADKQDQLRRLEQGNKAGTQVQVVPMSQNAVRMQQFYDNLGAGGYAEQQLKTLFDIAAKHDLKLNQGEYKSVEEKNTDTIAYQIQLPVTGPYPAIREFCEEVLLTIPFAALNEIGFKRESIDKNNLEANLRFTLYLAGKQKAVQS